jgi:hypothetical protein
LIIEPSLVPGRRSLAEGIKVALAKPVGISFAHLRKCVDLAGD